MSYKLSIVEPSTNTTFNVRYENLAKAKRPEIIAKTPKGDIAKLQTTFQGKPMPKGSTQKKWLDDKGMEWSKQDLTYWMGDQQVEELEQTKVFEIEGFQPLGNYTDNYVISTYYEIFPDDNGMKKDIDRERAVRGNTSGMYKLWEKLDKERVVARGEFCPASRGFVASDGYIRAIKVNGNKWALEIGVFKEEKVFQHLQEGVPSAAPIVEKKKGKRVKMI